VANASSVIPPAAPAAAWRELLFAKRMFRRKAAPGLIRGGCRFADRKDAPLTISRICSDSEGRGTLWRSAQPVDFRRSAGGGLAFREQRSRLGALGQVLVAVGDLEHRAFGRCIGQLVRDGTGLLGALAPMVGVVDKGTHDGGHPGDSLRRAAVNRQRRAAPPAARAGSAGPFLPPGERFDGARNISMIIEIILDRSPTLR